MSGFDAERILELLGRGPDALLVFDADMTCRFATGDLLRVLGLDPRDLLGRPILSFIDPLDVAEAAGYLSRLHRESFTGRAAARIGIVCGDGSIRPTDVLGATAEDGSSSFVLRDAAETERDRESEHRLSRFESLLNRVFTSVVGARLDELDAVLHRALADIGRFIDADLGYIARLDGDGDTVTVTHLWTGAVTRSDLTASAGDTVRVSAEWLDGIRRFEAHLLADPPAQEAAGIRCSVDPAAGSLLQMPLMVHDEPAGALCFSTHRRDVEWRREDITVLRAVASAVGQVLQRLDVESRSALMTSQLRATFDDVPVGLALLDPMGRIAQANPICRALLGLGEDDHPLMVDFVHPDDVATSAPGWFAIVEDNGSDREVAEFRVRNTEGGWTWIRSDGRPVRDEHGRFAYCASLIEVIDDQKRVQEALARSEARFGSLVENLPDAVFRLDPDRRVALSNSAAMKLWRRAGATFPADLGIVPDPLLVHIEPRLQEVAESGRIDSVDFELVTDEDHAHLQAVLVPETSTNGIVEHVIVVIRDVTEQRHSADELAYRASHDLLTGLPNRSHYMELLEEARGRLDGHPDSRLAVLFFDLDRFKQVNDSLGHAVGDALLIQVAERLRRAIRPNDVLARLGGDEFTVLMEEVDEATAMAVANRLLQVLRTPIRVEEHEFLVGGSIGVVVEDDPTIGSSELLRRADTAMYHAKDTGRARVSLFDARMVETVERRLELDQRLRTVVARNELRLHFQPEVRLNDRSLVGAEVLLRWAHPDRGLLAAGEFIQHAEETGMIESIGAWVLERSCEWAAKWLPLLGDQEFVLRVNVSARQLTGPAFVSRLAGMLSMTGLPPERLCLEITETALMSNAAEALSTLSLLNRLGVSLAVDDFGTGYSSLAYLKRLPVDVLKIDRSFVDGLPDDAEDTAIVSTIIRLAESLAITPTAEGVETEQQRATLVAMGVNTGQGYLFSKPLAAEEFERRFLAPMVGAAAAGRISAPGEPAPPTVEVQTSSSGRRSPTNG